MGIFATLILLLNTAILKAEIYVNEIYPNPNKGETEWVELYYSGSADIDTAGWYIDDIIDGGGKPQPMDTTLRPESYYTIELGDSYLNNTKDEINIIDETGSIVLKVNYTATKKGQSIVREEGGTWDYSLVPTRGMDNQKIFETVLPVEEVVLGLEDSRQETVEISKSKQEYKEPVKQSDNIVINLNESTEDRQENESRKNRQGVLAIVFGIGAIASGSLYWYLFVK